MFACLVITLLQDKLRSPPPQKKKKKKCFYHIDAVKGRLCLCIGLS